MSTDSGGLHAKIDIFFKKINNSGASNLYLRWGGGDHADFTVATDRESMAGWKVKTKLDKGWLPFSDEPLKAFQISITEKREGGFLEEDTKNRLDIVFTRGEDNLLRVSTIYITFDGESIGGTVVPSENLFEEYEKPWDSHYIVRPLP